MRESVGRQAFKETAAALRLNRPIVAVLWASLAIALPWLFTHKAAWGAAITLGAALILFGPLFVWNVFSIFSRRLAAVEEAVANAPSGAALAEAEKAREMRQRRRQMIDEGRKMVADYELQRRWDWRQMIRYSPAHSHLRPHLSAYYLELVSNPDTVIARADGLHDTLSAAFLGELDRLEREWGLS